MIKLLDRFLNQVTMYRLVLYYLLGLVAAAFVLAFFGLAPHDPTSIAFSAILIVATCWIVNWIFARVYGIPVNAESVYITALILVLILQPSGLSDAHGIGVLVAASAWAMASKFILASGGKHVFNPAALAAVLTGAVLGAPATWWVAGNLALLPFILAGGILLIRKLRRLDLVATFLLAVLAATLVTTAPAQIGDVLLTTLQSSPLFFFAFVMLTEPLTAPTGRLERLIYAALVGILFTPSVHLGWFYFTPELALVIGNFLAFLASRDRRVALTLEAVEQVAADTYDFVFATPRRLAFEAGQYLEWTLPVQRSDSRGNRRYFTVASSPTEDAIRMGVKFYSEPSAFKQQLAMMKRGDTIVASQVAGAFTLPRNTRTKLAFVAGGIGITPFRSMLRYLVDRDEPRSITMLYGVETESDIAYRDTIEAARERLGVPTYVAVAKGALSHHYSGFIDDRMIREAIPDYRERLFYVSGPQAMVTALRRVLIGMGVRRSKIKVDFFPGFA